MPSATPSKDQAQVQPDQDAEQEDVLCAPCNPIDDDTPEQGAGVDPTAGGQISLDEVKEELMRIKQRLPKLEFELETKETIDMLLNFRTDACDLPLRQCLAKRGKGCLKYHNQQHFRRKLLQPDGKTLAYFDMLCRFGDTCPLMEECPFAHSKVLNLNTTYSTIF